MDSTHDNTILILALAAAAGALTYIVMKHKENTTTTPAGAGLPVPTPPLQGRVTSPFGRRSAPVAGASTYHNGVDLAAPIGTQVRAPWDGTIAKTYYNEKGGYQMLVDHPGGYRTGYAHLSQFVARAGDRVAQGDLIALTGNTGIGTGPHLHFTLTDPAGNKIDPQTIFTFKA